MKLELLTTLGCHLCKDAETMVRQVYPHAELTRVDIAECDEWIERYGTRIPVLRCGARELDWPFSLLDIRALAEEGGCDGG